MSVHGGTSDPVSRCIIRSKCTGNDVISHRKSRDVLTSQSNVCLEEVSGLVERAAPHLTDKECQQLRAAMAACKHLFAKGKGDLGRTDIVQRQIHTGDQPAIKQRVRRYPAARREEERQLVEDMLAIGIIQESNSAWSSPTVLVKKKDGMTRFCIDYRRLNQVTKVDAYPLPHIEDSLSTLGGARFFCSLDLASGLMPQTERKQPSLRKEGSTNSG